MALSGLVGDLAAAGEHDRAERIAPRPEFQVEALSALVEALAAAGDRERALVLTADAERIARELTHHGSRGKTLWRLVEALAAAGERDRAECIAREITYPESSQAAAL